MEHERLKKLRNEAVVKEQEKQMKQVEQDMAGEEREPLVHVRRRVSPRQEIFLQHHAIEEESSDEDEEKQHRHQAEGFVLKLPSFRLFLLTFFKNYS